MHDVNKYVFLDFALTFSSPDWAIKFLVICFCAHLDSLSVLCTIWSGALRTPMLRKPGAYSLSCPKVWSYGDLEV